MSKSGANRTQAAALGHNKSTLNKHIDTIIDKQRKMDTLKAEIMNEYKKADENGFDKKALKFIVKERARPMPLELKCDIDNMRVELGDLPLFNLPEPDAEEEAA